MAPDSLVHLKQLRASRGYAKAAITRMYAFTSNANDVELSSISSLQSKRARSVELFAEYESYNKEILSLLDQGESDTEDVVDIEAKYFQMLTILNEAINAKSTPSTESSSAFKAKLPTIQIPTFTGKYNAYTSRAYQLERSGTSDPTVEEFLMYLEKRALALENAEPTSSTRSHKAMVNVAATAAASRNTSCNYCAASGAPVLAQRGGFAIK